MNWGEIKQTVRNYLENNEATFVGHLGLYARLTEETIYRQVQLQVAKQLAVSSLTPNDRYLTLPTNALSVYSLSYTNPVTAEQTFILPKDFAFLKEAYPNPAIRGMPRFYGYRDEQVLMIVPTPDRFYTMDMHYFSRPNLLSISLGDTDTNTNWLSDNAENALIFGIILHGYTYEKGDQDVIAMYQKHFDGAVADLKLIAEGRQNKDTYRQVDARLPV